MKNVQWIFLFFSVLAALSLMLVGIAIGERSPLGIVLAFILFAFVMGLGFKKKRSLNENEGRS